MINNKIEDIISEQTNKKDRMINQVFINVLDSMHERSCKITDRFFNALNPLINKICHYCVKIFYTLGAFFLGCAIGALVNTFDIIIHPQAGYSLDYNKIFLSAMIFGLIAGICLAAHTWKKY